MSLCSSESRAIRPAGIFLATSEAVLKCKLAPSLRSWSSTSLDQGLNHNHALGNTDTGDKQDEVNSCNDCRGNSYQAKGSFQKERGPLKSLDSISSIPLKILYISNGDYQSKFTNIHWLFLHRANLQVPTAFLTMMILMVPDSCPLDRMSSAR